MPENLVVDASVAIKWLIEEAHTDRAADLLLDAERRALTIMAPPAFPGEVTNALYQQERRGNLSSNRASGLLVDFLAIPFELMDPEGLFTRALDLARRFELRATYDAQYLVVAETVGAELWSADEALIRATQASFPLIRWIGDYTSVGR